MYNNLFRDISPISAYWAGFLMADGSVMIDRKKRKRVYFGLKSEDKYMVEQFLDDINMSHIKIGKGAHISNSILFDDLYNLGIVPNKCQKTQIVTQVEPQIYHFIRGVFDGDGTIGLYQRKDANKCRGKFGIYGYLPFLNQINSYFDYLLEVRPIRSIHILTTSKWDILQLIYNKIYDNNHNRFLMRKKQKFDQILLYHNTYTKKTKYTIYINNKPYQLIRCNGCGVYFNKRVDKITKYNYCGRKCYATTKLHNKGR